MLYFYLNIKETTRLFKVSIIKKQKVDNNEIVDINNSDNNYFIIKYN